MKKLLYYFTCAVIGFFLPFCVEIGQDTISIKEEITYNCTYEEQQEIEYYLNMNDAYYREFLKKSECVISVKDEVFSDDRKSCFGYIKFNDRKITLDVQRGYIDYAFNHEIGHLVDYETTDYRLSDTDEFWEIYVEERDFFDSYTGGCSGECFAESYKYYIQNDVDFKNECPGLYGYMMANVKGGE